MNEKDSAVQTEKPEQDSGPKAIRVTPEGRREVDPWSIITRRSVITQLRKIRLRKLVKDPA